MGTIPYDFNTSYSTPQEACDAAVNAARSQGFPDAIQGPLGPFENVSYPIFYYDQQQWLARKSYGHKCQFTQDNSVNIGAEFG